MELEKLTKFNDWWTTKKVKDSLLKESKRPVFHRMMNYLRDRQIILITGLRRVGKTTLMYQLIQHLLDNGIKETSILYFSFDEGNMDFEDIIKTYNEKIFKKSLDLEKIYLFIDEIQKCENWQNNLKIYYDLYPNIKFVISGSALINIAKNAKETLAGRIFDFVLEPLSFKEFLEWKSIKLEFKKTELFGNKILPYFNDYLRKGGFPELLNEENEEKIKNYIKNNVIDQIIYKDLPEEFGIKDYELLKTLIEMISNNPGLIINYDALSRDLKKNKKTIIDYFFYLEYSMLIKLISNYRSNFLTSSRKMRKAYLRNTSISFLFMDNFYSNKNMEKIAENLAVIESNANNYYRNKYEIDIIIKTKGKIIPLEVKYGMPELKSAVKFLDEFKLKKIIILTKDIFENKKFGNKSLFLIPLWAFSIFKDDYFKTIIK